MARPSKHKSPQEVIIFGGIQGLLRGECVNRPCLFLVTVDFKNDYFIICGIFTVITLQDWVGWGKFTVIPGYPRRASGDSQLIRGMLRITGWAPVRIIYRKK